MSDIPPKIVASIYLRGDQLEPEYVSNILGISSTYSQKQGELRPGSKKLVAKIGVWRFTAETKSDCIADHINDLLATIKNISTPMNQIKGVEEAFMDIFIGLDENPSLRQTLEFSVSKEQINLLGRLGLALEITIM